MTDEQQSRELPRLIKSFGYAFQGIWILLKTQPNARIHLLATGLVVAAGFYYEVSAVEWCLLTLAIGTVWTAEGMNTAIEFTVDLASPEQHPLAGHAKDVAAGATLLAAITAAILAGIIFLPKIL